MAEKLNFRRATKDNPVPNNVPRPTGTGQNSNVKGVEAAYGANPTLKNYPQSIGPSTIPIKFAEKEMTTKENPSRTADNKKGVPALKSGRGAVSTKSNQVRSARRK